MDTLRFVKNSGFWKMQIFAVISVRFHVKNHQFVLLDCNLSMHLTNCYAKTKLFHQSLC